MPACPLDEWVDKAMKPSEVLEKHKAEIREIIKSHRATNPRVFGSVARGEDAEESDIDIMVDVGPKMTLFDLGAIKYKISELLGVKVDVITADTIPEEYKNKIFSESIEL